MNLAQLRQGTYSRVGQATSDPVLTQTVINAYINDALHFIETDADWPWLQVSVTFDTVVGTDVYATPDGWLQTRYLRAPGERPMERYSVEDLDGRYPTAAQGLPCEFAVDTDQIMLRPVPDGVYVITHRYVRQEPDLAGDTAVPLMPASFHSAICEVAAWMAVRQDREDERAPGFADAYKSWRERMLQYRRRGTSPIRVRVRPF